MSYFSDIAKTVGNEYGGLVSEGVESIVLVEVKLFLHRGVDKL